MRNVYIALAAILLIGGCSSSEAEAPATTPASGTVASTPTTTTSSTVATSTTVDTSESSESVFQLSPGDCFNEPIEGEFENLLMVDCDAPHDNEAYASYEYEAESRVYPGELAFEDDAIATCGPLFEEYVGSLYEFSRLDFGWFFPTIKSWIDGDRQVDCVLFDYELNKLTGSMRNSGE